MSSLALYTQIRDQNSMTIAAPQGTCALRNVCGHDGQYMGISVKQRCCFGMIPVQVTGSGTAAS